MSATFAPIASSPAVADRGWSPDANEQIVYNLVKFGGQTQQTVARMLGISQPTVSRIIDRCDRWEAHAKDRAAGRLDPAERLRAQRWLTYERNELILASALRIAAEMEGFADVSKSVIARPIGQPSSEREIRTESSVIDRHGIAARFLRLAFRINMEQLKLVSQEAPPLPAPLSLEEVAEQEAQAAAICAQFEALRRADDERTEAEKKRLAEEQPVAEEMARLDQEARAGALELIAERRQAQGQDVVEAPAAETPAEAAAEAIIQPVNKMNKCRAAKSNQTRDAACTCAADCHAENFSQPQGTPSTPSGPDAAREFDGDWPREPRGVLSGTGPQGTAGPAFPPAVA